MKLYVIAYNNHVSRSNFLFTPIKYDGFMSFSLDR